MNEFASTENSGLLKDAYPDDGKSALQKALSKKRKKLAETRINLENKEEEDNG